MNDLELLRILINDQQAINYSDEYLSEILNKVDLTFAVAFLASLFVQNKELMKLAETKLQQILSE